MAQEEARQRAQKRKFGHVLPIPQNISKRYKITFLKHHPRLDTTLPLIEVEISKERKAIQAFLDTGSDDNIISYELFECLNDVKLTQTQVQFQDYSGHLAPAFGCCVIKMFVQGLTCGDEFFVTHPTLQIVPLILGRAWQQRYNCSINWANQSVSCTINEIQTSVKLHQPVVMNLIQPQKVPQTDEDPMVKKVATLKKDLPSLQPINSSQTIPRKKDRLPTNISSTHPNEGTKQQSQAQGANRQVVYQGHLKWIPKALLTRSTANAKVWISKPIQPTTNNPTPRKPTDPPQEGAHQWRSQRKFNSPRHADTWQWVRKDVLQARRTIPRQKKVTTHNHNNQRNTVKPGMLRPTSRNVSKWVPKTELHPIGHGYVWIKKQLPVSALAEHE